MMLTDYSIRRPTKTQILVVHMLRQKSDYLSFLEKLLLTPYTGWAGQHRFFNWPGTFSARFLEF